MRFSFLIFDLDGTLIDSAADLRQAVNHMLAHYRQAPLELTQIKTMIGDGAAQLVKRSLAARGVADSEAGAALRSFHEFYAANPSAYTTLYPGVRETLESLRQLGMKMAVCTNKPSAPTTVLLRHFDLERYFVRAIGGDTWSFRKPDPRMLTDLIDACGARREQTLLIGDSEVDAATATAAAVDFALVEYGYRRGSVESIAKSTLFDRFEQVLPFVLSN
jgi:phosphoglycolate phosphatase